MIILFLILNKEIDMFGLGVNFINNFIYGSTEDQPKNDSATGNTDDDFVIIENNDELVACELKTENTDDDFVIVDNKDELITSSAETEQPEETADSWAYFLGSQAYSAVTQATSYATSMLSSELEPEFIQWRIDRYEKPLSQIQEKFLSFIDQPKLRNELASIFSEDSVEFKALQDLLLLLMNKNSLSKSENESAAACLSRIRKTYKTTLISNLRSAHESLSHSDPENENVKNGLSFVRQIAFLLYDGVNLNKEMEAMLHQFSDTAQSPVVNAEGIPTRLSAIYEEIGRADSRLTKSSLSRFGTKVVGHNMGGINYIKTFDPNLNGNPVHVFYDLEVKNANGSTYRIKEYGMGTPTINIGLSVEVNREFLAYLEYLQENNHENSDKPMRYFYINNQELVVKNVADENGRCLAIHNLSQQFPKTFFAITLSQNSKFHETGICEKDKTSNESFAGTADLLKKQLMEQMFDCQLNEQGNLINTETGNYIPQQVRDLFAEVYSQDIKDWSKEMINQIHTLAFKDKVSLNELERRAFIRVFYLYLSEKILLAIEPHAYNESCKDRIDRGAASSSKRLVLLMLLTGKLDSPKLLNFLEVHANVRSIMAKERRFKKERFDRLKETVNFMTTNADAMKELAQYAFPGVEFNIDESSI